MSLSDAAMAELAMGLAAKPRLLIAASEPSATVARLAEVLASSSAIFDRGMPVKVVRSGQTQRLTIQPLKVPGVILEADRVARPYTVKRGRNGPFEDDVALPRELAAMYLEDRGGWGLRGLDGLASAPLLGADGSVRSVEGYDPATHMYCDAAPSLTGLLPDRPTRADAEAALRVLRARFETFAFADSVRETDSQGISRVRQDLPPGADESAALAGLLTAVCRPSLDLAPGIAVRAAGVSGSGSGKGLLIACICLIAYGQRAAAVTPGGQDVEFEKRIETALIEGGACVLLDNVNNRALRSDALDSALTECPAKIRKLGVSEMLAINSKAFIAVTGNALHISEDSTRRFLDVQLDAGTESPETRRFPGDIAAEVLAERPELLAAALTIWRWGRMAPAGTVPQGLALGSYTQWAAWVRDPLLALGCRDPACRVAEAKARDPRREQITAVYEAWDAAHGSAAMTAVGLCDNVKALLAPIGAARQKIAREVANLAGTRVGGFTLKAHSFSGVTKYALEKVVPDFDPGVAEELNALLAAATKVNV